MSQKIKSELLKDESILWSGRPRQGIIFRGPDAFMIPFSLIWCGFAVSFLFYAYEDGAPFIFLLVGSIFSLIGIHLVVGRFITDILRRKSTYYGVTNNRVLILSEFPTRKLKSLKLDSLSEISFAEKQDGSGSITLGLQYPRILWSHGEAWPGIEKLKIPMFVLINDVKNVYEIINNARNMSK